MEEPPQPHLPGPGFRRAASMSPGDTMRYPSGSCRVFSVAFLAVLFPINLALQMMWFGKIVRGALKLLRGGGKKSED